MTENAPSHMNGTHSPYLIDVDRLLTRVRKAREERKRKADAFTNETQSREVRPDNGPIDTSRHSGARRSHASTPLSPTSSITSSDTKDDEIRALIEESNRLLSQELATLQRRRERRREDAGQVRSEEMHQVEYAQKTANGNTHHHENALVPVRRQAQSRDNTIAEAIIDASSLRIASFASLPKAGLASTLFPHLHAEQYHTLERHETHTDSHMEDALSLEYIVDEDGGNGTDSLDAPPQLAHASQRKSTPKTMQHKSSRLMSPAKQRRHSRSPQLRHEPLSGSYTRNYFNQYDDPAEEEHQRSPPRRQRSPCRSARSTASGDDKYSNMTLQDVLQLVNQTSEEIRSMSPRGSPREFHSSRDYSPRRALSPRRTSSTPVQPSPGHARGSIGGYNRASQQPVYLRNASPRSAERPLSYSRQNRSSTPQRSSSPYAPSPSRSYSSPSRARLYSSPHSDQESVYSRRASLAQSQRKSLAKSTTFIPYSEVRHLQSRGGDSTSYNHSTMHWFLNLCSDKKMKHPSRKQKRVAWVGLSSNGRSDRKLYPDR